MNILQAKQKLPAFRAQNAMPQTPIRRIQKNTTVFKPKSKRTNAKTPKSHRRIMPTTDAHIISQHKVKQVVCQHQSPYITFYDLYERPESQNTLPVVQRPTYAHSKSRATERTNDVELFCIPKCPICQEAFGLENIVVLSCGHQVHASCLMSFRRFSRSSDNHKCPSCHQPYKIVRMEAETEQYNRCARDIQRVFRGFSFRRQLKKLIPQGSLVFRSWVMERAKRASTRLACAIEDQSDAVDAILASIDKELDWARTVMKAADERDRSVDWEKIIDTVNKKDKEECPICLRAINNEDCMITSCCHCYHKQCLQSWLTYCTNSCTPATCPMCRSVFQHRLLIQEKSLPKIDPFEYFCL